MFFMVYLGVDQIQPRATQVHPHITKVEAKILQEIGQILDGNTGKILMGMVKKWNVVILLVLWTSDLSSLINYIIEIFFSYKVNFYEFMEFPQVYIDSRVW